MARLNDPPSAAESVDALKRRFVRQNRELARINSNQSVRIRNLENEISRLLSENIAFRERIIKLQQEVDKSPGQAALESIGTLKAQLEAQVAELSSVVKALANVQFEPRRASRRRSIQRASPKRSPDQRNWKNGLTLSEVTGATDGRLPSIAEDKCYPRRTAGNDELRDMLDSVNALDSPDLGPPPVASWEEEDPVKGDLSLCSPSRHWKCENIDGPHLQSLANLETRKKRRESTHRTEGICSDAQSLQLPRRAAPCEDPLQPLKAGAKRKLNIRDEDAHLELGKMDEEDAFYPDREAETENNSAVKVRNAVAKVPGLQVSRDHLSKASEPPSKVNQNRQSPSNKPRKALSAKSVNTDPSQSPTKYRKSSVSEKFAGSKVKLDDKPIQPNRKKEKLPGGRHGNGLKEQGPPALPPSNVDSIASQPETPAAPSLDILPPQSPEPRTARQKPCDTPPPADLASEVTATDAFGTAGRASRRARNSVSYAEPSLRDKMRRPTKELIDAVGADDRPQIISVQEVKVVPQTEQSKIRTVVLKKETPEEPADWRDLPMAQIGEVHLSSTMAEATSPLSNKCTATCAKVLPETVKTDRRRHDSSGTRSDQQAERARPVSASGFTISTLVAGSQKSKNHGAEPTTTETRGSKDIFELNSSSPADAVAVPTTAPARTSRRRSSMLTDVGSKATGVGTHALAAKRDESRRESTVKPQVVQREYSSQLNSSTSGNRIEEANEGRVGRVANRRKSMMI